MSNKKVYFNISIDGNNFEASHLIVRHRYDWHAVFQIHLELSTGNNLLQHAGDYVGKKIAIELGEQKFDISAQALGSTNQYLGVVTGMMLQRVGKEGDSVVIIGEGLSKLLDEGDHTRSFTNKSLKEIVDSIFGEYDGSLIGDLDAAPQVNPSYTTAIPYVVQYKESNFEFLIRLANTYAESFYYTGQGFVFGKPAETDPIRLFYGLDLEKFELALKTQALGFKLSGYDYTTHEFPEAEANYSGNLSEYADIAYQSSKEDAYKGTINPVFPFNTSLKKEQLEKIAENKTAHLIRDMVILHGVSQKSSLQVGQKISLKDSDQMPAVDYGTYLVLGVEHFISASGDNYSNTFEAVPAELEAMPQNTRVQMPFCEEQLGEVKALDDPDSLGRVQVQFNWQKVDDEKTPWIRVITPYHGKDKGAYFIPEIGDWVWVNFENHHPDFPYVSGSFYHKNAEPEHFDRENKFKVIKTRSGNQIFISDEPGKECIRISNPDSKNEISLTLEQKPTITIHSEANINISGKEISISGGKVVIQGTEIGIIGEQSIVQSAENFTASGKASLNIASENTATIGAKNLNLQGELLTDIKGKTIKLNS